MKKRLKPKTGAAQAKMNKIKIWETAMKIGNVAGCHQRADRSFFIKGYQFPLCARCTGMWLGSLAALFLIKIFIMPLWLSFIFSLVMLADWAIQYKGILMSTNARRLITGFLCGAGITDAFIKFGGVIFCGR